MNFLVLGSGGMAGHVMALYLKEAGENVSGFARRSASVCKTIIGDARDEDLLSNVINGGFDVVINCIGVLNKKVDNDLPDGIYINSYLPHFLAKCCDKIGAKLIHISTDCVFSGQKGQYDENAVPDAVSWYGKTKYLGEVTYTRHLTLRTSIVGPELKENGTGLFHWFMQQTEQVPGFAGVYWGGITTLELAKVALKAAKEDLTGLYHVTNNEPISKYELLQLFNKFCRRYPAEIIRQEKPQNDKSLRTLYKCFDIPSYTVMVKDMAEWMQKHRELYEQYE